MSSSVNHGVDRGGLDLEFVALESNKSGLLLEAQMLRAQGRNEDAGTKLAKCAHIEEQLSERCLALGLQDKAWIHRFSAASCWAQAGNFYQAIAWCDNLLSEHALPHPLRSRVQDYAQQLRARRTRWYADLDLATAETEDTSIDTVSSPSCAWGASLLHVRRPQTCRICI